MKIILSALADTYELQKFVDAGFTPINPTEFNYYFSNDGSVYIDSDIVGNITTTLNQENNIIVASRRITNSISVFVKVLHYLYGNKLTLDRDINNYFTKGIPKINSAINRHFNMDSPIDFYVAFNGDFWNNNNIQYPIVYKPVGGNHGEGIFKIDHTMNDMVLDYNRGVLFEEFLDKKFEYRVVTFDKKIMNFAKKMLKTRDGNQFGGRRFKKKNKLHSDYINYIRQYANNGLVGMDICRTRDGRIVIIEQNRAFEFESLDRVTEKDTAQLIFNNI